MTRSFLQNTSFLDPAGRLTTRSLLSALLFSTVLAFPAAVNACSVCFGARHDPQMRSALIGAAVLLGITGAILLSFAAFAITLMRRSRMATNS